MLAAIRELEERRSRGIITDQSAALLKEYLLTLQAERGMSDRGLLTEFRMIIVWSKCLEFATMTTMDILEAKLRMDARGLKKNTMRGYLYKFLRFARWCADEKGMTIDTSRLDKIKIPSIDWQTRTAEGMLTSEEVFQIIEASKHPRDKAIFALLYEGGFRPVEIVRMNWGQVKFDPYGVIINTAEKTGNPRYIRLISSKDRLARWKDMTPGGRGASDPVFILVNKPHTRITYTLMQTQLKTAVKRAGIQKEVSLYLFRHSRITHMIEQEIPESVIKMQHWGSMRTGMLATYVHITGNHTDDVLLARAGIQKKKIRPARDPMAPLQCPDCLYVNSPGSMFCNACGLALNDEGAGFMRRMERAMKDPKTLRGYAKYLEDHPEEFNQDD